MTGWYLKLAIAMLHVCMHQSSLQDMRVDQDGLFLSQFDLERGHTDGQLDVPPAFAKSLMEVLRPSSTKSFNTIQDDLKTLADEALVGIASGCGLCYAFLAFIISLGSTNISVSKLHAVLFGIPDNVENNVVNLLYGLAKDSGSTFGLLGAVKNGISSVNKLTDSKCEDLANQMALFARESASVDVFDELIAPHPLPYDLGSRPRDRISTEVFDDDTTDVHYYISLMKNNAQALSSAFLFGIADVADMLGLEEDELDEEDLRESVERLSVLDDETIAKELILTINAIRHNVQVIKFNEGLELYSTPHACHEALLLHHGIVGEQSLFSKLLFLFLKENFYDTHNVYNGLLVGMILSELGVESGIRNVQRLLEARPEILQISDDISDKAIETIMVPGKDLRCAPEELLHVIEFSDGVSCLDSCVRDSLCGYATITGTRCAFYKSCNETTGDSSVRLFVKKSLPHRHPCWPPTSECLVALHKQLATTHAQVMSFNWLARYYDKQGDWRTAAEWAERSANHGDPEGIFFSGYLQLKSWEHHPANPELASKFFRSLLSDWGLINLPEFLNPTSADDLQSMEDMEIDNARNIAQQLGINDIPADHARSSRRVNFVNVLSGFYGLVMIYSIDYSHIIPRIWTVVALIPVLVLLLARRAYIG